MKKTIITFAAVLVGFGAYAQDAQQAAADAAKTIDAAPTSEVKVEKPKYWDTSLKTNITIGQTQLTNWAAGGDNTISLAGFIDANANFKKNEMFLNNRLQLDYGFLYASSKPILQKNSDRIYLESKWGYKTESMKNFYFSANYDFRSQFTNTYDYPTPVNKADGSAFGENETPLREDWLAAKSLKSGFLAPAYTNLALGIDYNPTKWLAVNFAPLTGGFVIVKDMVLRNNYSMALRKEYVGKDNIPTDGSQYRSARFEFGAQLKVDAKLNINDNFSYSTQLVLFSNYLDKPQNMRVNWDNRIDWKLAKYFSFTVATNLIYDDKVMIYSIADGKTHQRIQFRESIAFGFTYTIAGKR